jgi:uncharacterized protein with von Willebrand factor type A (vWA) domain
MLVVEGRLLKSAVVDRRLRDRISPGAEVELDLDDAIVAIR